MKELRLPILLAVGVFLVDQLTKYWALHALEYGRPVEVLGRFFMLTLVYNRGGAMGTNLGSPWLYLALAFLILPLLAYYLWVHRRDRVVAVPLAVIAGGALGNVVDRLRLGHVVDFLDVDFFDVNLFGHHMTRWWTFNLADAAISCGILFLVVYVLVAGRRPPVSDETATEPGRSGSSAGPD